jgi:hypothetical protein
VRHSTVVAVETKLRDLGGLRDVAAPSLAVTIPSRPCAVETSPPPYTSSAISSRCSPSTGPSTSRTKPCDAHIVPHAVPPQSTAAVTPTFGQNSSCCMNQAPTTAVALVIKVTFSLMFSLRLCDVAQREM